MPRKTILSSDAIRSLALAAYAAGTSLPDAIREIDVAANRPTIGLVSPVYWNEKGRETPLGSEKAGARTKAGTIRADLARSLARRRDSGVRWEILAASVRAGTGDPFSVADAKAAYALAGADLAASYVGRGTRKAAPKTYAAPAASVAAQETAE